MKIIDSEPGMMEFEMDVEDHHNQNNFIKRDNRDDNPGVKIARHSSGAVIDVLGDSSGGQLN
jgi:hypothetical protein